MKKTLYQDLWEGAAGMEPAVALRCGDQSLTFAVFFREILRAEAGLRALGVQSGDLVTILSLNTPEAVIAFYAIDRIGAVANWVDMKLSPAEVEFYLTRAKSKVVLVLELISKKYTPTVGMRRRNILWCFLWLPISRRNWGGNSGWASGKRRRGRDVSPGKNFSKIQGNLFRNLPAGRSRWPSHIPVEQQARPRV